MKKLLFLIFFCLTLCAANAQKGAVSEQKASSHLEVKSNLWGIKIYDSQTQECYNKDKIRSILSAVPNQNALYLFNQGINTMLTATVFGAISGGILGWTVGYTLASLTLHHPVPNYNYYLMGIGAGLLIPGIVCDVVGRKNIKKSISLYNDFGKISTDISTITFNFGVTQNGIGVVLRF